MAGVEPARSVLRLVLASTDGRPVLTPSLVAALLESVRCDRAATLVAIEGAAGTFCEGLDFRMLGDAASDPGGGEAALLLASFAELLSELRSTNRPVIAIVDGVAMGGGVGIAAAADIVLASRNATFALPETLFGLIPGVVFPFISARIGVSRTLGLALGGRTLSADEAYHWGLVDQVCDDVRAVARRYERRILKHDPSAQAEVKALVRDFFPLPAGYIGAATERFATLRDSSATRARLSRYVAGDTPWDDGAEDDR